ncbi:MAG: hypothetical protein LBC30_04755, partial [Puniceicoccales bacterium]|nr:hypothetical protein [Puniceicoccales bacterium]
QSLQFAQALLEVRGGPAKAAELVVDGKLPNFNPRALDQDQARQFAQALLGVRDGSVKVAEWVMADQLSTDRFSELPSELAGELAVAMVSKGSNGIKSLTKLAEDGQLPQLAFTGNQARQFAKNIIDVKRNPNRQEVAECLTKLVQKNLLPKEFFAAGRGQVGQLAVWFLAMAGDGGIESVTKLAKEDLLPKPTFPNDRVGRLASFLLQTDNGIVCLAELITNDIISKEAFPKLKIQPSTPTGLLSSVWQYAGDFIGDLISGAVPGKASQPITEVQVSEDIAQKFGAALLKVKNGPAKLAALVMDGKLPNFNPKDLNPGQSQQFAQALLGVRGGSVKVAELVMAGKLPNFNPKDLNPGQSQQFAQALLKVKNGPAKLAALVMNDQLSTAEFSKLEADQARQFAQVLIKIVPNGIECLATLAQNGQLPLPKLTDKDPIVQSLIDNILNNKTANAHIYRNTCALCLTALASRDLLPPFPSTFDYKKTGQFAATLIESCGASGTTCLGVLVEKDLLPGLLLKNVAGNNLQETTRQVKEAVQKAIRGGKTGDLIPNISR